MVEVLDLDPEVEDGGEGENLSPLLSVRQLYQDHRYVGPVRAGAHPGDGENGELQVE